MPDLLCKLHWVLTPDFHENQAVADFERLYLGAQMELEGVLRLKTCLRELIGTQELIWSEKNQSHSRENKTDFFPYRPESDDQLFGITLKLT